MEDERLSAFIFPATIFLDLRTEENSVKTRIKLYIVILKKKKNIYIEIKIILDDRICLKLKLIATVNSSIN